MSPAVLSVNVKDAQHHDLATPRQGGAQAKTDTPSLTRMERTMGRVDGDDIADARLGGQDGVEHQALVAGHGGKALVHRRAGRGEQALVHHQTQTLLVRDGAPEYVEFFHQWEDMYYNNVTLTHGRFPHTSVGYQT